MPGFNRTELLLEGAYGRTYAQPEQALADWNAGKDFRIVHGPYCSVRDLEAIKAEGYTSLHFFGAMGRPFLRVDIAPANPLDAFI
jgi:hypothetical protein